MTSLLENHSESLKHNLRTGQASFAVVGLGYQGLPLAKDLARRGFSVVGLDQRAHRVEAIKAGKDHIDTRSSDLGDLLERLRPSTDFSLVSGAQVVFLCVPTPLNRNLEPDTSTLENVCRAVGEYLEPGTLVILESTTFPGTTEELVGPNLEKAGRVSKVGQDYYLAFSPERSDLGNKVHHRNNTPRILGGATDNCLAMAKLVYSHLLGDSSKVLPASSPRTAELEKLFENIFRSVNIALVNELALICEAMGLDVWEILELASTKPYGFLPFTPGPGLGGHCVPLDPIYLSWKAREFDFKTHFIELASELNAGMPRHVLELISENLGSKGLDGANILVAGVAYKPNVTACRESPSLRILELLRSRGAQASYFDPLVPEVVLRDGTKVESLPSVEGRRFDLVVLVTLHAEQDLRELCALSAHIVDTRGFTRGLDIPGTVSVLGVGHSRGHSEQA